MPTYHEKIRILVGNNIPRQFKTNLEGLKTSCETRNIFELLIKLKELVPDYNPGAHILKNVIMNNANQNNLIAELAEL
jgi:hypothetical protein